MLCSCPLRSSGNIMSKDIFTLSPSSFMRKSCMVSLPSLTFIMVFTSLFVLFTSGSSVTTGS